MKKFFACFAVFTALVFAISCGGSSSKPADGGDTDETVTDEDSDTTDSEPTDDSESSDTNPENPDNPDTTPDNGDTEPDNDADTDSSDTVPDSDDEEPVNENPDNLPECSPTSATPCIDSETVNFDSEKTNLIWSGKSPENMHWADAVDYCKKLNEGGYSDWQLPTITVLKTLVRTCESDGYSDGKCSKFGDIVFLWSSTGGSSESQGVFFYNGAIQSKNVDETFNLRCVRREGQKTREVNCLGLIENSVWNTTSQITQTWDWNNYNFWTPPRTSVYSEIASGYECRFKCEKNYYWCGKEKGCQDTRPPATLGNICTGQNKCYNNGEEITCPNSSSDDFFGQDATQGVCTPQSFTVQTISSEEVVLDNNTGLMWQQTIPTSTYIWESAVSYCDGLTYAGYSDWRLPTPQELLTIVDNSKYDPAIDTTYFPGTPSSYFWSSSTNVHYANDAWIVSGSVDDSDKTHSYNVLRCVRGTALPTGSFTSTTVQGDVIVTDTETGLIWQKTYVTDKTWQEALSYCETLTYAGYSDWRLPNKNELASLVNYGKYNPASDFPDMPSNAFWSSSTYVINTSYAWSVDFSDGEVGYHGGVVDFNNKTISRRVRCVR